MSNIQLFKQGNTLPSYIKNVESNLAKATFSGGSSGKNISIKGGVWRMIVDGEEVAKNEDRAMNFVIVNMSEKVGRVFYEGAYEEGKEAVPVCWSADGDTPNVKCEKVQATSCMDCPQNIKGSGQGDSRACRFTRSLAVVLEGDMSGDVYRLNVPAMSIFGDADGQKMPLEAYRKFLKGHGIPLDCVVTEARFDTSAAVPKLFFSAVRPLSEDEFHTCQEQGKKDSTVKAVTIDFSSNATSTGAKPAPKAKPKAQEPELPAAFAEAPVVKAEPVEKMEAEEVDPPVRRASKPAASVESVKSVDSILDEWANDDE